MMVNAPLRPEYIVDSSSLANSYGSWSWMWNDMRKLAISHVSHSANMPVVLPELSPGGHAPQNLHWGMLMQIVRQIFKNTAQN